MFLLVGMPLMGLDHTGLYDRNVDVVKQKRQNARKHCKEPERPYYYAPQQTEEVVVEEFCLDDVDDEEEDE